MGGNLQMVRNFSVAFVVGLLVVGASQAHAGWGSWGGSHGSYGSGGSYGSYASSGSTGYASHGSWGGYASSGGSWGGSYGSHGSWGGHRPGPLKRMFAKIHARKMARRAYRHAYYASGGSWGGSYGSHGSHGSYGSHGSHGSWGGSYGSHGSTGYASHGSAGYATPVSSCGDCGNCDTCSDCGGDVIDGTYTPSEVMEETPVEPSEARRRSNKGVLVVSVPDNAEITVNGLPTTSTGAQRRYVSHGLQRGEAYRYVVKATMERDGETLEQTKVAMLRAGKLSALDFDFDDSGVTETVLTLNVPEDAKVFLSGNDTRATGEQRRYSTTRIPAGKKWADYVVRVTVERNGQTLSKEQEVTLKGGDQTELDFNFDQTELADAR